MKMTPSRQSLVKSFITVALAGALTLGLSLVAAAADATWKELFEDVCGKVMGAESMSEQELTSMVEKADKAAPMIQASDDPGKKVYLMRLKKCRAVYDFILEAKKTPSK
jgi:hypothetical protein